MLGAVVLLGEQAVWIWMGGEWQLRFASGLLWRGSAVHHARTVLAVADSAVVEESAALLLQSLVVRIVSAELQGLRLLFLESTCIH